MTKFELYQIGVEACNEFLSVNKLVTPKYCTYEDAEKYAEPVAYRVLERHVRANGRLIGSGTGLYTLGHVFVNVPVTAWPVARPMIRSWSFPRYKTDRTAVGVVAHEVGHYVEHYLQVRGDLKPNVHGPEWREVIRGKKVTSYEPVPSEAWAESMRLFILNPDLLKLGIPKRYKFITERCGLMPSERRGYAEVLGHEDYIRAAKRWIDG